MASGRKNYFRHSFFARNDDFILDLMDEFGFQGYFIFFSLLEICGEQASDIYPDKFKFHASRLRKELRLTTRRLNQCLTFMQLRCKLSYTLVGNSYEIIIPNFSKYLGKYQTKIDPNVSNKRKGKERKGKETNIFAEVRNNTPQQEKPETAVAVPQKKKVKTRSVEEKSKAKKIKLVFFESYKQRYGVTPTFAAAEHSMTYRLLASVGYDEAYNLAKNYPNYNDPWHVGQKHPFRLLISQLDKVRIELADPNRMLDERRLRTQIRDAGDTYHLRQKREQLEREIEEEEQQRMLGHE